MKDDEKRFLIDVYTKCGRPTGKIQRLGGLIWEERYTPRMLINGPDFYMHHKRAWYLLDKWNNKGWYEWGTVMDHGWLTPEGKQKASELS